MGGESWCRRFRTDSEQFQVQQRQASECGAFMTSDAEEDVCTPSTLMFQLTVFQFGMRELTRGHDHQELARGPVTNEVVEND